MPLAIALRLLPYVLIVLAMLYVHHLQATVAAQKAELESANAVIAGYAAAAQTLRDDRKKQDAAYAERETKENALSVALYRTRGELQRAKLSTPATAAWADTAVPSDVHGIVCAATRCASAAGDKAIPARRTHSGNAIAGVRGAGE